MSRSGFLALIALPSPRDLLLRMARLVMTWNERQRMRAGLGRLDDHLLRDIGLDAARARDEAEKPCWRA